MTRDARKQRGSSRREFIKRAAAVAAAGTAYGSGARVAGAVVCPDGAGDIALINGRFLTLDDKNTVAGAVTIRNGRFEEIGTVGTLRPCAKTIDLKGATVIPGLIDSHLHFIRDGLNPGHEVRIIETATSIAELQAMINARAATVPAGEFITCVGGWNRNAFGGTAPTLADLTVAAPNHPVYIAETGGGGAGFANALGKAFFESQSPPVPVNATTGVVNTSAAFIALRVARDTNGDPRLPTRQKTTEEAIDFVSSLGMTMVHDVGGNGGVTGNTSLFVDLTKPYDQALNLWRQNNLKVRIRTFFYSDTDTGFGIAATRMASDLIRIGDDVFRYLGVGERVNVSTTDPGFIGHCQLAAASGWTVQQHSSTQQEIALHVQAYQAGNAVAPIKNLRWSLTHVNSITDAQIQAMIAMNTGFTVQGTAFTSGTTTGGSSGTPFRAILDQCGPAGVPVGGGSDATNVGALNPWLMMYFMTTGKNNAGVLINTVRATPQSCTRLEALKTFTKGSAYFSFDDDRLGSIETGKLADLAVLNDNPLTVSDDQFKRLRSVMTMQAGKIVYGSIS